MKTHIKQQSTGGAVSSVDVNDVFSANYNAYRIFLDMSFSTAVANVSFRLRVGGSTESSTIYRRQYQIYNSTSITGVRETNNTGFLGFAQVTDNKVTGNFLEIYNPFETVATTGYSPLGIESPRGNILSVSQIYGINNGVSYTGFTIFPSVGTFDGTVTVLGYRK